MIDINTKDKVYKIPNRLSELTISQYQEIMSLPKDITKYQRMSMILGELGEIPQEVIDSLPSQYVVQILNNINLMLTNIEEPLHDTVEIDGKEYKFEDEIDGIRFDQFIDLYEMTNGETTSIKNLHMVCAILYREIISKNKKGIYKTKEYLIKDVKEQGKIFKELPMDVAYGVLFFFLNLKIVYLTRLQAYSAAQQE